MKNIREIITDLNVARSNNCSKEKSEEIKKIINDLLPHEKQEKALEILKKEPYIAVNWFIEGTYEEYVDAIEKVKITKDEWNFVKEELLCQR